MGGAGARRRSRESVSVLQFPTPVPLESPSWGAGGADTSASSSHVAGPRTSSARDAHRKPHAAMLRFSPAKSEITVAMAVRNRRSRRVMARRPGTEPEGTNHGRITWDPGRCLLGAGCSADPRSWPRLVRRSPVHPWRFGFSAMRGRVPAPSRCAVGTVRAVRSRGPSSRIGAICLETFGKPGGDVGGDLDRRRLRLAARGGRGRRRGEPRDFPAWISVRQPDRSAIPADRPRTASCPPCSRDPGLECFPAHQRASTSPLVFHGRVPGSESAYGDMSTGLRRARGIPDPGVDALVSTASPPANRTSPAKRCRRGIAVLQRAS